MKQGRNCGGYTVRVDDFGLIYVNCCVCGAYGARRLAKRLRGVLGRFETSAPRAERLRLAQLLTDAADPLDAKPDRCL